MPDTLSDQQMQDLAQEFHYIAFAIGQVRLEALKAGAALTDPRMVQLQGLVFSLTNISSQLALESANLTLDNADAVVNAIKAATAKAEAALNKLKGINKAINIGSALIVLAAAISTKDLGQIATAAKSVFDAASAPSMPDPAQGPAAAVKPAMG